MDPDKELHWKVQVRFRFGGSWGCKCETWLANVGLFRESPLRPYAGG